MVEISDEELEQLLKDNALTNHALAAAGRLAGMTYLPTLQDEAAKRAERRLEELLAKRGGGVKEIPKIPYCGDPQIPHFSKDTNEITVELEGLQGARLKFDTKISTLRDLFYKLVKMGVIPMDEFIAFMQGMEMKK